MGESDGGRVRDTRGAGPGGERPPGIKDVAALAGVSWKTVSNVVNDTGRVGAATRERVEAAIAQLGYRPSLAGRQLRQGRTRILALAVPYIHAPYFASLAHAVIEAAAARGYRVFIDETRGDADTERQVARGFDVQLIDGIVFSPLALTLPEVDTLRGHLPMVLLGERTADLHGELRTDHVNVDDLLAAREAVRHLAATGRRRLGFLGAEPDDPVRSSAHRLRGFSEELVALGLASDDTWLLPVPNYTRQAGAQAIEDVLARVDQVDGLLCGNDELALGAIHALLASGVRVPEDIAIVGWDNTEDGRYANPSLTTVAPDVRTLARLAVDRVVAQVEQGAGEGLEPIAAVVPHRLLVRESTRPAA